MAKFKVTGDDFVDQLKGISAQFQGEAIKAVLEAGAAVVVQEYKRSIESHGHVRSRDMLNSVGTDNMKLDLGSASVEIYPRGNDSRGVRNAQKAYVINYGYKGKKSEKTGDKFVAQAERNAAQRVHDAQQQALDRFISEKGMK